MLFPLAYLFVLMSDYCHGEWTKNNIEPLSHLTIALGSQWSNGFILLEYYVLLSSDRQAFGDKTFQLNIWLRNGVVTNFLPSIKFFLLSILISILCGTCACNTGTFSIVRCGLRSIHTTGIRVDKLTFMCFELKSSKF